MRVQTSPKAHFNHRRLYFALAKDIESHCRDALEKSGMRGEAPGGEQFLDGGADARERGGKFLFRNFLAAEANAFVTAQTEKWAKVIKNAGIKPE